MIVADTNLVAYLVIEGDLTPSAREAYRRDPDWVVPPLWRSEFLSVLVVAVRSGVLTEPQAQKAWRTAVSLIADVEQEPDPLTVLRVALAQEISAYDAQFVALAMTLGTVLVSADRKLVRRCPGHAVHVDRFTSDDDR